MISFTDQLKRNVELPKPPVKIISLVPSITELLADLGLENEIAGITKFCVHPEHLFRSKPRIGGTKKIDHDKIRALAPDFIIASKEENTKADIELLEKNYPVYVSDVKTLDDAIQLIGELGTILNRKTEAEKISLQVISEFKKLTPLKNFTALYLIWKNPYMAAGGDTFISEMMLLNGMSNVLKTRNRYPELTAEEISNLKTDLILLSSEPYPFKEKDMAEIKQLCPGSEVILVDGEYFSWYGSRLTGAPAYFSDLNKNISYLKQNSVDHHLNK